jgi:hypothetical protein
VSLRLFQAFVGQDAVLCGCNDWSTTAWTPASPHRWKAGFLGRQHGPTGCGKTLANARIMYALSHPQKDDFGIEDLYVLTLLVHWAGLPSITQPKEVNTPALRLASDARKWVSNRSVNWGNSIVIRLFQQ